MAGLRKLVMDRTARLMTRIAIRRGVLMVGILSLMTEEWELGNGGNDEDGRKRRWLPRYLEYLRQTDTLLRKD